LNLFHPLFLFLSLFSLSLALPRLASPHLTIRLQQRLRYERLFPFHTKDQRTCSVPSCTCLPPNQPGPTYTRTLTHSYPHSHSRSHSHTGDLQCTTCLFPLTTTINISATATHTFSYCHLVLSLLLSSLGPFISLAHLHDKKANKLQGLHQACPGDLANRPCRSPPSFSWTVTALEATHCVSCPVDRPVCIRDQSSSLSRRCAHMRS
jgi:hypothetical protein